MDNLSQEIKKYLSLYSKKMDSVNMEIVFGYSLGKYIFDTNVLNRHWNQIIKKLSNNKDFSHRKEFTYTIYSYFNKKLYIDTSDKMKCIETDLTQQTVCYNDMVKILDVKVSLLKKQPINTALFPSCYKYHTMIKRDTISFNYHNQFYINLSTINSLEIDTPPIYTITILLSKNNRTSKNIVFKNLMRQVGEIYNIIKIKLNDVDFSIHHKNHGLTE